MSPFSISGILIAISSFGLGLLVFLRSTNRRIGTIWFLFTLSAVGWGAGAAWIGGTQDTVVALLAWKLAYGFGVIWIAPLFFHFVSAFLNRSRQRMVISNYLIGFLFSIFLPGHRFFARAEPMFGEFGYALAGPVFPIFLAWWIGLVVASHIHLAKATKAASAAERNQIQYFFVATAFGFIGGSLCYLPNLGIRIYPWGNFTVPLYPIIMAYAMLRFNLMDVRLFVRRAFVLTLVYVFLIVFALMVLFSVHGSNAQISRSQLIGEILIVSLILSLGPVIYAYLVRHSYWLRGQTAAGLTHELKSPLVAIQSATEILLAEVGNQPSGSKKSMDYIHMIRANATRLENFVSDLLNVANNEPADVELSKCSFDLAELARSVMDQHRFVAENKGLSLNLRLNGSAQVFGDAEKIRQAISNLIANSIKFSKSGDVTVRVETKQSLVQLAVSDQGRGLSGKNLTRIFDRFYQVDRGAKGTGIGLTIAKIWIEAHGGRIWAESEGEGKGTTVTFTLPASNDLKHGEHP